MRQRNLLGPSSTVLTHPGALLVPDVDGEGVVGREHGGDRRGRVRHANPVGDASRRHRHCSEDLERKEANGVLKDEILKVQNSNLFLLAESVNKKFEIAAN